MTGTPDPLVDNYVERLREAGKGTIDPGVLSDILRSVVCESLEAAIEPVELAIRQCIERGDRQREGARYHGGYTVFAPDLGKDRRGLAIQGAEAGFLLVLETDLRSDGTLFGRRTVPMIGFDLDDDEALRLPTEISAYGFAVLTSGNDVDFAGLIGSTRHPNRYSVIASATESAFFDRKIDLYHQGHCAHSLASRFSWINLFAAMKAAFTICDLTDRMRVASGKIHDMKRMIAADPAAEAAKWVGRHLAVIEEHLPGRATEIRLGLLKRHFTVVFRGDAASLVENTDVTIGGQQVASNASIGDELFGSLPCLAKPAVTGPSF